MTTWLGTRVRSPICAGWRDNPLALAGPAVFGVPPTPLLDATALFRHQDGDVLGADVVIPAARPSRRHDSVVMGADPAMPSAHP